MKKALVITAILLLMVSMVSAQSNYYVSPSAYTSVEAGSNNTYPFYNKPFTYMQIHDDLLNRPMLITQIAFRGDGGFGGRAAFQPTVDLWVSTATCKSSAASATYANNHGQDKAQVITNTKLNFPPTATGSGPHPFTHKMPFAKMFVYKGSISGSLAWEVRVTSTTATSSTPLDCCSIKTMPSSYVRSGTGGTASGKTAASYCSGLFMDDAAIPGNIKLYINAYNLPNSASYTWLIGYNNTSYGAVPLPFDLTFLGGKGNSLYLAPIIMLNGTTSATGMVDTQGKGYLSFTKFPGFESLTLYSQVVAMDTGNPAFPLVLTDLCATRPSYPNPSCRIYSSGNASATTGSVGSSYGLVTRFEYK